MEQEHYFDVSRQDRCNRLSPNRSSYKCAPHVLIRKYGPDGITWSETDSQPHLIPSSCRDCADPLGAGDQFIATLAYCRCLGDDWDEAIAWASVAAGLQCERRGCVPVTAAEIAQRLVGSFAVA